MSRLVCFAPRSARVGVLAMALLGISVAHSRTVALSSGPELDWLSGALADAAAGKDSIPDGALPLRLALALDGERRAPVHAVNESSQGDRYEGQGERLGALRLVLDTSAASELNRSPFMVAPEVHLSSVATNRDATSARVPEEPASGSSPRSIRPPEMEWEVSPSDGTLHTTLRRWAAVAQWQLLWDLQVDYPVEAKAVLSGTFEEAIAKVAKSLEGTSVPVQVVFYSGNRVLRIIAKGSK